MMRQFLRWVRDRFNRLMNPRQVIQVYRPVENQGHGDPPPPQTPFDPAREAFQSISPCDESEEYVVFRSVGPDGAALKQRESWFYDANLRKFTLHQTKIVTSSGDIVSPESVLGVCQACGGYAGSNLWHCFKNGCGVGLCGRCVHFFSQQGTERVALCRRHFNQATDTVVLWKPKKKEEPKK